MEAEESVNAETKRLATVNLRDRMPAGDDDGSSKLWRRSLAVVKVVLRCLEKQEVCLIQTVVVLDERG